MQCAVKRLLHRGAPPAGQVVDHRTVAVGCKRLQGHGGDVHIRRACRQPKAAVLLLSGKQCGQHRLTRIGCVLHHGKACAVQRDECKNPAVQSLFPEGIGGFPRVSAVRDQVDMIFADVGRVAVQRQKRQGNAVPLRRADGVQAALFPVFLRHIVRERLAVALGADILSRASRRNGKPVGNGIARCERPGIQKFFNRAALIPRHGRKTFLRPRGQHQKDCQKSGDHPSGKSGSFFHGIGSSFCSPQRVQV